MKKTKLSTSINHSFTDKMCSCLHLLAYWTPPPSWPRRMLCENKFFKWSCSRTCWLVFSAILLTYFLVMDVLFFSRYQTVDLVQDSKGGNPEEIYTPITHLSIKAILNDHPSQFFIAPSTEYFNLISSFSSKFSFITPNMISFAHLVCGFISGKFIASENLQDRRIGVILYEVRTWIDALDGTVHRAQAGLHLQYHSNHSSLGYAIDSLFDTLGGCFLCFSILFYLMKKYGSANFQLPFLSTSQGSANSDSVTLPTERSSHRESMTKSMKIILWKSVTFGLCLAVTGKCWDQAVEDFSNVFQVETNDYKLARMQYELSHAYPTQVIFYLWRLFGGQSVLNYILVAIYMDKVWEFLKYTHYFLLLVAMVLYAATFFYIHRIKSVLNL